MTPETKRLVLSALGNMRGDSLERARMAFRGLSYKEMQEEHGNSGFTRQEILDGYEGERARVDKAIKEVEGL